MLKYKDYSTLINEQQKEYESFTKDKMFFAFTEEQFNEGMKRFGLAPDDTDKVYQIGFGGYYILRAQAKAHNELVKRLNIEKKEHMKDFDFLKSAFHYELANHEFCITYELDDTLDALLLTYEQVNSDPVMKKALLEAKKEYLKNCEDWM